MASSSNKNKKKKQKKQQKAHQMAKKGNKKIQKKENKINIVIVYSVVIILFIVFILYNMLVINKNIKELNEDILDLKKQRIELENITPHYVFLGDSITEQYTLSKYFEGYSVVNSGISGDTTQDILDDMEERIYRYNPSTVFLMIGTNDVNINKSADYVFNNIKKIVQKIQINLPNTKIVIESIIPSQEIWTDYDKNEIREEINELLYNEYKNTDVIYLDLYSILEDENKEKLKDEYTTDGLHLNEGAYEIISKELKKYMIMKNK